MSDLISRKAVIKALLEERERYPHVVGCEFNAAIRGGIHKALREVEMAPAVDAVEVVHGRWIYRDTFCGHVPVDCHIVCTNCKTATLRFVGMNYKYCPYCGAKMDAAEAK